MKVMPEIVFITNNNKDLMLLKGFMQYANLIVANTSLGRKLQINSRVLCCLILQSKMEKMA
jgi:hypothetical protein